MSNITVTSLADSLPIDPTLPTATINNGYVFTWNSTSLQWEAQPAGGSSGGSGVTPPFIFSKDGNLTVGSYLRVGAVISSNTGQLIIGSNRIVKLAVSAGSNAGSTTRLQLRYRTAVSTFTDITDAYIDLPSGSYNETKDGMAIDLNADSEISAYNKSGSTLTNVILMVFLIPR